MINGGCWIFLSHSSKDISKVRIIRNEFERFGHNPLAFHLLCLNADTEEGKSELDSLIKREIDAREWFVFCESDSAKNSAYVAMEKEYIISTGKKKIWSINMNLDIDEILSEVANICKRLKVFISYSARDKNYVKLLENELLKKDFDVWSDLDLNTGDDFQTTIHHKIEGCKGYGCCVLLITEKYLKTKYCMTYELPKILADSINVIPLIFGNVMIPECLEKYHCYHIPDEISKIDFQLIADLVEAVTRQQIKGPMNQADAWTKISQIQEKINPNNRYHPMEAELIKELGPWDDYCEVYRFPCCGKIVRVGNGPVSRFRDDGCCK